MSNDRALAFLKQGQANLANAIAELAQDPNQPPNPPTPVNTIRVKPGDDLQRAIDGATLGQTILVDPRGSYSAMTLRAKQGTGAITIQPDTSNLVSGQRVAPAALGDLIKLTPAGDGTDTIKTDRSAAMYVLRGFAPQPPTVRTRALANLGDDLETVAAALPRNVTIDQWLVVGDPNEGGKRGIIVNAFNVTVRNSHIAGLFFSEDAQAIVGWNGMNSVLIENNFLESSGENCLVAGGDARTPALLPQNIVIRGNYMTKPLSWRARPVTIPAFANMTAKNTFEIKAGAHILVEFNTIENSWQDGQDGSLALITTRNQDGQATFSQILDATFRCNVCRHGGAFMQIMGLDDKNPSQMMSGLKVIGNLVYDIDPRKWNSPKNGDWGSGRMFLLATPFDNVEIAHNSVFATDPNKADRINSAISIYAAKSGQPKATRLVVRDNVLPEGSYGIAGADTAPGRPALDAFCDAAVFTNNLLVRGNSGENYPYGPQPNFINDPGKAPIDPVTLMPTPVFLASCQTTDGKPIGCDLAAIRAGIRDLDLTK